MYPQPTGPQPSAEQIRDLDDTYFASDPTGYFHARIDALLSWAAAPLVPAASELAKEFEAILGAVGSARRPLTDMDRRLQVSVDALQIRHQAAEALLRLLHARIGYRENPEMRSLWLTVIETPTRAEDLVEGLRPSVESADFLSVAAGLLLPVPAGTKIGGAHLAGVRNALQWVYRAAEVLSSGHIDLNAANNKIKHGVTARAEGNLRVTFMTLPPDGSGNPKFSDLTGQNAFDIFDTTVLEYISRPPGKPKNGYERTLLRADAPTLLAEAWMIAITHGALFHTAANLHFGDRGDATIAPHPGLAAGPNPEQILANKAVGMRFPLTTPPGGGDPTRPAGLALPEGFLPIDFGQGWSAIVQDG